MSKRTLTILAAIASFGLVVCTVVLHLLHANATAIFASSCVAIVPLAFFLGKATARRSGRQPI
jgi:Ca2+/H+ antiporter